MNEKRNIVVAFFLGVMATVGGKFLLHNKKETSSQDKFGAYYDVLNKWMKLKENNQTIEDRLKEMGIKTIAIYGMGDLGHHLIKDLENSDIEVKYAIDRSFLAISEIDVYEPDADMPLVDAIVITPVFDYENICKKLQTKMDCKLLSIGDLVGGDKR